MSHVDNWGCSKVSTSDRTASVMSLTQEHDWTVSEQGREAGDEVKDIIVDCS